MVATGAVVGPSVDSHRCLSAKESSPEGHAMQFKAGKRISEQRKPMLFREAVMI